MPPAYSNDKTIPPGVEFPIKAELRKDVYRPLPTIAPGTIDPASMVGDIPTIQAKGVLNAFNVALLNNEVESLASLIYVEQAFWQDIVALTSHLRTFAMSNVVAAALLRTKAIRVLEGEIELVGEPHSAIIGPSMMFIDCAICFRTTSPALSCMEKVILLPVKTYTTQAGVSWKIWVLSTWVEKLLQQPEKEQLLISGNKELDGATTIETDVFILGAGTSGLMTAARLKATGAESIVADRIAQIGDNWTRRYDSLRFHRPTSNCEMPHASYSKELHSPHRLTKYDVAEHLQEYAKDLHLNVMLSSTILLTVYNTAEKKWVVKVKAADGSGTKTVISKHFIQATGIGSGKPYLPEMECEHLYKGVAIHSVDYRSAQLLVQQGAKSVVVIGSVNTASDVIRDCCNTGLTTTMVARSPTYVLPYEYVMDPHGIGAYDLIPVDAADKLLCTIPQALDGQFSHALFAHLASQEPDRYLALARAGFPVLDSRDPSVDVQHHLVERGGCHYVDVGGTKLISEGRVAVRGLVGPVAYTETGLRLSEGSTLDADAVIWCTGLADTDVRASAKETLGLEVDEETANNGDVLGPTEIAARIDATWGVDSEGEVRGIGKRHLHMENYWVIGGVIKQQRWWSRAMAQQIKLSLDGNLPPA